MIVNIPKKGADSKLIMAINAMIKNRDKISNVQRISGEYLFSYKDTYVWSISYFDSTDEYCLSYYNTRVINDVIYWLSNQILVSDMISYHDSDYKTQEARESFSELYIIVKEKLYNVDLVLDDIIKDIE